MKKKVMYVVVTLLIAVIMIFAFSSYTTKANSEVSTDVIEYKAIVSDIQIHWNPNEEKYYLYIKDTNAHLFVLTEWEDEIWLVEPNQTVQINFSSDYADNNVIYIDYNNITLWGVVPEYYSN